MKEIILLIIILTIFSSFFLNACSSLPGGDAKKNPPNPDERVKKNLEEGKGFRLDNALGGRKSTNFQEHEGKIAFGPSFRPTDRPTVRPTHRPSDCPTIRPSDRPTL